MTLFGFILTVLITLLICLCFTEDDYLPDYLQVWVINGRVPLDKDDKIIGDPYFDEHNNLVVNVKITDKKTFLDKAKREFLRRIDTIERKS